MYPKRSEAEGETSLSFSIFFIWGLNTLLFKAFSFSNNWWWKRHREAEHRKLCGFLWRLPSFSISTAARKVAMGLLEYFSFSKINKWRGTNMWAILKLSHLLSIIKEICNNHKFFSSTNYLLSKVLRAPACSPKIPGWFIEISPYLCSSLCKMDQVNFWPKFFLPSRVFVIFFTI